MQTGLAKVYMEFLLNELLKKIDLDGFEKKSNSRRANFVIMRRTKSTLNDCKMKHNTEVGIFMKPSLLNSLKCCRTVRHT